MRQFPCLKQAAARAEGGTALASAFATALMTSGQPGLGEQSNRINPDEAAAAVARAAAVVLPTPMFVSFVCQLLVRAFSLVHRRPAGAMP